MLIMDGGKKVLKGNYETGAYIKFSRIPFVSKISERKRQEDTLPFRSVREIKPTVGN